MIGNNSIEMNQGTMIEAVEFYLNSRVMRDGAAVKVKDIKAKSGYGPSYTVEIEPAAKEELTND
jgi:hypothetical protein